VILVPRISVYIPDELNEQIRALPNSENISRLIQGALERLVADEMGTPSYAQRPDDSVERILEIREHLLAQAREDYEQGYAIALEAASGMPLHVINALVSANYDLVKWLDPYKRGWRFEQMEHSEPIEVTKENAEELEQRLLDSLEAPTPSDDRFRKNEWWWLWKSAEALGSLADPIGGVDEYSFDPTQARQRGFVDALRELWSAIEKPGQSFSDTLHKLGEHEATYWRSKAEGGEEPRTDETNDS
jgi:hypothetical protein